MAVCGCIDLEDGVREVNIDTMSMQPDETTATLKLVSSKAVERIAQVRDVKAIANQNFFTIQSNNGAVPFPSTGALDLFPMQTRRL